MRGFGQPFPKPEGDRTAYGSTFFIHSAVACASSPSPFYAEDSTFRPNTLAHCFIECGSAYAVQATGP